ncbi:MAG: hypothetical protein JO301_16150 [Chitinophagaceae bacterium]|nr:hypothetical protein [Chitinophagaceae bacterium]
MVWIPLSCTKNLTQQQVLFQSNFENNKRDPLEVVSWNSTGTAVLPVPDLRISSFNGTHVLGKLNNGYIKLTLEGIASHQVLQTEFDLYLHDTWKNDLWRFAINDVNVLLTGFSNDTTVKQSYPNWLGNGSALSPAGKNAIEVNLPGACALASSSRGTSRYRIISTIEHTGNSVTLIWGDAGGFFNDTCKRSWSIDNVKVTAITNY